ncbi:MAG TPA: hypothetical protein VIU37_11530 [Candidatus Limnocylindrales bacterium]
MPGPQLSFRASSHEYIEKFYTTAATTISTASQDVSPSQNSVQSYGFLRRIKIRLRNNSAADSGNFNADYPQKILSAIQLTDPNGAEIYGGPTWSGYEAFLAEKYGTYKTVNDPNLSQLSSTSATTPLYLWTIPLELAESSGYGSLPNFDAQSPYKLKLTLDTIAHAYLTAPTTNPSFLFDGIIECWTLPDAVNKLTGYAQSQFPPGIGPMPGMTGVGCTVQHWTKSNPSITAASAVSASMIRKGNTYRNLVAVVRNSSAARIALTNFPNPITFALDGAPLWNNIDPAVILENWFRRETGQAGSTNVTADTGVLPIIFGAVDAANIAGVDGTLGSQGWLGNNQASRIELSGTWGATASALDILTNDVNGVSLEGSAYAFAFGQQLAAASQPSVRSGG